MGIIVLLFGLAALAISICSLVCFVMVLIQMFNRGEQTMGIVCIVLAFCSGIGTLIAFVYGWIKASEWGLKKVMLAWTGCMAASFLLAIVYFVAIAAMISQDPALRQQIQQMQQN
jgi:hypothetical protein